MTIERELTSYKTSEKLKELGIVQHKSQFYYVQNPDPDKKSFIHYGIWVGEGEQIAAFLSSELGRMLPPFVSTYRTRQGKYWSHEHYEDGENTEKATEVESKADILIMLINKRIVTVEEINRRIGG